MACAAKPISNLSSMANGCLTPSSSSSSSSPAIFAVKSYQQISLPLKPIKLHLSAPSSSFSLRRKPNSRTLIAAHQEEENTLVLQEDEELSWGIESQENETAAAGGDGGAGGEEEYSEPSEDAKIFVGNLPYDVGSEKLAHLFEKAGVVEVSEELGGRFLTVNKAAPRGSRPERTKQSTGPSYTMYVGNLPWDMDDGRLEQVFSEHGKVVNARIVYDRESGRSRGFGFVSMSSQSQMNDAIENLDGQSLGGRAIRVNVAAERRKRGAF